MSIFNKNLRIISKFESTPEGWKDICVNDICILGRGRVISQEEIKNNPGQYPVYSSQTKNDGIMGRLGSFDYNTILITWTTDGEKAGTVFYRQGRFNCTNVCGTIVSKERNSIDLKFLHYHIGRISKNYVSYIGNPKLMNDIMGKIAFPLPPQDEQKEISKVIGSTDRQIKLTEGLIEKYQQIKQGMMHDLFRRGVTEDGKLRPTYEDAPHLYKESPLGFIPKEWEFGTIEDYCFIHNNLRKPLSAEVREHMKGEFPYYGPTGIIDYINEYRVEGEYCLLGEDGDHFLKFNSWSMTILTSGKFNVNNHAHILTGKNGATTKWIHTFFEHRDIGYYLTRQGAGRFKLNKASLKTMAITIPSKKEQFRIMLRIQNNREILRDLSSQTDKLISIKQGLMQDLLTGRVRVNVD